LILIAGNPLGADSAWAEEGTDASHLEQAVHRNPKFGDGGETMATGATAPAEIQPETQAAPSSGPARWHWATRTGFRFFFAFFIVFWFPSPLYYIPGTGKIFGWYYNMSQAAVLWVGKHLLRLSQPVSVVGTGSGDKAYDYIHMLCCLTLGVIATVVWSALDRKRLEYQKVYPWLRLYVRVILGITFLSYGAAKVIKTQFPPLFLSTLVEPYGESSPMSLLWSFMQYSGPYTVFTGIVEMLAGALLFVPRLSLLGGLLGAAAMTNVFMLNMSYDVPVKLYSLLYLVMSVFLVAPDLRRLAGFFVFNRTVEAAVAPPLFRRLWLNRSLLGLQLVLCLVFATTNLVGSYEGAKEYGFLAPKPPLYGIWSVEEFTVDGELRPPLLTDDLRWQRVIFDRYSGAVAIQKMSGERLRYALALDLAKKKLALSKRTDTKWKSEFTVEQPQPELVLLDGKMDGRQIHAKLRLQSEDKFLLLNRGFHWVNEVPFNR
jgi:uncharacterized membrane protein YphA (DoxX/SURF4 family)